MAEKEKLFEKRMEKLYEEATRLKIFEKMKKIGLLVVSDV